MGLAASLKMVPAASPLCKAPLLQGVSRLAKGERTASLGRLVLLLATLSPPLEARHDIRVVEVRVGTDTRLGKWPTGKLDGGADVAAEKAVVEIRKPPTTFGGGATVFGSLSTKKLIDVVRSSRVIAISSAAGTAPLVPPANGDFFE